MPKVSRNPVSRAMQQEMLRAFVQTLAKVNDDVFLQRFLDDLLSPTEKLMLAKRLMAAILLQRGYSGGAVCTTLKMSKTTVWLIQRELAKSGEGYRTVFERFFRESRGQRTLNVVERFLDAITLPIKGSRSSMRRWKRAIHH